MDQASVLERVDYLLRMQVYTHGVAMAQIKALQPNVGDYRWSGRSKDYGLWLVCDGRHVPISKYPLLYSALTNDGADLGVWAGSNDTCFRLPDARGRVLGAIGRGADLTPRAMGDVVGHETCVLSVAELPAHSHPGTTAATGAHSHEVLVATAGSHTHGAGYTGADGAHGHSVTDPGHAHTQTTINDDFNDSGTNPPGFTRDSAGSMTWENINANTTGISIVPSGTHAHAIPADGSHSHSASVQQAGDHVHAFNTASVGAGGAFGIVQPTVFCANLFICGLTAL